ncbi:hypothetical protein NC653_022607 [Populus alba x Populus x berolinensis]|uniref:Uncharacterized protein n=1 Tax=Populus alba x Populus x berolinensis TaxID=444605 RepID=A0AAD6MF55_9ROSI|nr:hypothetical protein NC653_022607 [Populus alba x Populus x berolinensis]
MASGAFALGMSQPVLPHRDTWRLGCLPLHWF